MLDWILGLLGSILGGSFGQSRQEAAATQRMTQFNQGNEIRIPCALRYEGETFWRHGDLILTQNNASWAPPTLNSGKVALHPDIIEVDMVRRVSLKESMDINGTSSIVVIKAHGRRLELAIPREEMRPVRAVFRIDE